MKKLPKINTSELLKAALPYILVGLMATKLGQAYRMASGGDVLDRIFGAFLKIGEAFTNPLPSLHPFDLLVGAACGALLWFIVYQKSKNARKYRRGAEYGTARWGNAKDIEPFIDPDFSQNILLSETERLTLGKIADPEKRNVNLNVLVIGGSGSGKTRYHIKPNLLQMNASYVCSDPKGTVIEEVGRALVRGGYKIKVLNTIDFSCSMHYNPFVYLHSETDILTLVTVIMTNTQGEAKGGDGFWEKAEALLYQALIAYIYYEAPAEERNMNTLLDMLNACECREDDENFKSAVDLLFEQLEQRNPDHFAARQYKKFKMAAGKTLKSILISCGARLAPFDIAAVREMMSYDELGLEKLGDEKTALFAVVSDTDPTFNFISAMMYSQMFNVLCDRALKVYHGRLPVHVTCLFDEFANQKIPNWEHLVSVIRSRNISAHIVLQTFSQLKGMYKDNAETVAGCCSTMLFLGGKEESSLKMVSGLLGKETIDTMNESDSRGAQRTYGLNYQKLGKELMSVDELAVMPSSRCIVQVQGVRPFYSKKYDLTKHPQYKYTADANPKFAFDAPALARADVGIAIGAGTDVAIESADIVLMKSDLLDVSTAIQLSKAVIRNIKQNLFWAFIYNIIGIPVAAGLFYLPFDLKLNPMIGAFAMSFSSVFVVSNALRLRWFKAKHLSYTEPDTAQSYEKTPAKKISKGAIEMEKVLNIEGMVCMNCVKHVEKALREIQGIREVSVSLENKSAQVQLHQDVPDEVLKAAIEDAGYQVVGIQ